MPFADIFPRRLLKCFLGIQRIICLIISPYNRPGDHAITTENKGILDVLTVKILSHTV